MVTLDSKRSPAPVSKHIVGLDAIRTFACLIVIGVHAGLSEWCAGNNPAGVPTHAFDSVAPFVSFGWVGVQIFFVLSGFVIAYSAYAAKPGAFLLSRFSRLLPALVLCASITGAALLAWHQMAAPEVLRRWLSSISLLPSLERLDGSYWTLTLEMSFYLLVFAVLLAGKRHRLEQVVGLLGLGSASMVLSLAFLKQLGPAVTRITLAPFERLPFGQTLFLRHGCYFCLGVFLWLLLFRGVTVQRLVVVAASFVAGLAEIGIRSRELTPDFALGDLTRPAQLVWIASLLAIVGCTRWNPQLQRLLGERGIAVLRRLGLMTYPLYLIHQAFGKLVVMHLLPHTGPYAAMAIMLALVVLIAYVLATHLEPPLQRWFRSAVPQMHPARIANGLLVPARQAWTRTAHSLHAMQFWNGVAPESSEPDLLPD